MSKIPTKDRERVEFAQSILKTCMNKYAAWGIPQSDVQEFALIVGPAQTALDAHEDPQLRNKVTTANKNAAIKTLTVFMRTWLKSLEGNKKITDGELIAMGLPSRDYHYHGPKPPPTEMAVLTYKITHLAVKISASVPQEGHPTERVKRPDYHGLQYRWRVEGEEWIEKNTTRTRFTLKFTPDQVGKKVEIIAAWINSRLEPGPWGTSITVLVN